MTQSPHGHTIHDQSGAAPIAVRLDVTSLSAHYRGRRALHEVDLPPLLGGQLTCIVGPNAAGKSTLLRGVAGLQPTGGGVRLSTAGVAVRRGHRHMHYVPQDPPPPSSITVFGAVELALRLDGRVAHPYQQVATVLARLDLDGLATRRLSELSGGQRQMVGLAQAAVRKPHVLLLDEPTSSLDLRNQLEVFDVVADIAARHRTIVIAAVHDLSLAARVSDQIIVLNQGRVHSAGTPDEVITTAMLEDVYRVAGHIHPKTAQGPLSVAVSHAI